jgi:hypothetical protein
VGGEEGAAQVAEAERVLVAERVADVGRMLHLLVPGAFD